MPKPKKFVNPLLQSSERQEVLEETATKTITEPSIQVSSETMTQPETVRPMEPSTPTDLESSMETAKNAETSTETYTYSEEELEALVERRKRGKNAFDKTHERLTIWVLKSKKKKFLKLAKDMGMSHVELLDEALDDLFKKYRRS